MNNKTMEQPQPEWWVQLLKWAAVNTPGFLIAGVCFKLIDATSKFLTRLVDGRLRKISIDVMEEKIAPLNQNITDLKGQIEHLTSLMVKGK